MPFSAIYTYKYTTYLPYASRYPGIKTNGIACRPDLPCISYIYVKIKPGAGYHPVII